MSRRYIALLRGINVGRAKRIAMADLRTLITRLGFHDVRTLLNSGNVVFDGAAAPAQDIATRIEQALTGELGVASRVTVLRADELAAIVDANPLLPIATDHARLPVFVLSRSADSELLAALADQDWTPEVLASGPRAVYLWCPDGMLASPLAQAVGKLLGEATTARNWNTIGKLHALAKS
ncbi:MAG: DUF1697 domain-containing protein [Pseudomonadota bacterium]